MPAEVRRLLLCNPPWFPADGRRPAVEWPEELATCAALLSNDTDTVCHLADSVALGESVASCLGRVAELNLDAVVFALRPATLAEDLELLQTVASLRPTIAWWPGESAGCEALLKVHGVKAVVCGEPERGLLAALALDEPAVYPSDPFEDLDELPRPYRDYSFDRYRYDLPGLPPGPQLVARAGRHGRWHSVEWLRADLTAALAAQPRAECLVLADPGLAAEPERRAAYAALLDELGRPWAIVDRPVEPPVPSLREALAAADAALAARPAPPPRLPTLHGHTWRRVYIVGMFNPVYMPPMLTSAGRELGYDTIPVDPWADPRAIRHLLRSQPQDVVVVDRGLAVQPEVLARTPAQTLLYYPDPLPTGPGAPALAWHKYREFGRVARHYDHVVLHDGHPLEFLAAEGFTNIRGTVTLPYDPKLFVDLHQERTTDVLFVGLESPHRLAWMEHLRQAGLNVHWPRIWGEGFVQELARARIVLNLHSADQVNTEQRLSEAMACGCFVVSEPITDPPRYVDGEHFVVITRDTAADTIRHYLARPDEREAIARRAQAYVAQHFTPVCVLANLLAHAPEVSR